MPEQGRRRLRRGVVAALVLAIVVVGVGGALLVVRSRQVERSAEALCTQLALAQDLDQGLATLDPATLQPQVDALVRAESVAPPDIEGAVTTLAEFVEGVTATVSTAQGDREAALADALEARQADVDEVTAAGTAVQRWAQERCGLSLTGVGTTEAPTPETTVAP